MKNLLFFIVLIPFFSSAQQKLQVTSSRTIYFEKIIQAPQYSKEQLYKISIEWVSEIFISPKDVINFKDENIGKIKGVFYEDYKIGLSKSTFSNVFVILIKNGRLKFKINNINNVQYNSHLEVYILKKDNTLRKYQGLTTDIENTLNDLINNLDNYIKNYQSDESDW